MDQSEKDKFFKRINNLTANLKREEEEEEEEKRKNDEDLFCMTCWKYYRNLGIEWCKGCPCNGSNCYLCICNNCTYACGVCGETDVCSYCSAEGAPCSEECKKKKIVNCTKK